MVSYDAFATLDLGRYIWSVQLYTLASADVPLRPEEFLLATQHIIPHPFARQQIWPRVQGFGGGGGRGSGGRRGRGSSRGKGGRGPSGPVHDPGDEPAGEGPPHGEAEGSDSHGSEMEHDEADDDDDDSPHGDDDLVKALLADLFPDELQAWCQRQLHDIVQALLSKV
jgi:hypothetical protein